jgi:hypothetical protein
VEGVGLGPGGAVAIVLRLGGTVAIGLGLRGIVAIVLRLWETAAITDLPSPSWPAICTTTPLALAIDPQTSAAASGRGWSMMPPNPTAFPDRPRSRLPLLVAPAVIKVQCGPAPRSNGCRRSATTSRLQKIGLPSKRRRGQAAARWRPTLYLLASRSLVHCGKSISPMSAVGQKQTLHSHLTRSLGDVRLCPRKRTSTDAASMSAESQ